jgi:hypothetical protein
MPYPEDDTIALLVSRVIDAARVGEQADPATRDRLIVTIALALRAWSRVSWLRAADQSEVNEAAVEAVAAFESRLATQSGMMSIAGDRPEAYLATAARNKLRDLMRQSLRHGDLAPLPVGDEASNDTSVEEAVLDSLEAGLSESALVDAMTRARAANDVQAARVVEAWLRLARISREAPSLAAVGREVSLTGPGVREVMTRFRKYFR